MNIFPLLLQYDLCYPSLVHLHFLGHIHFYGSLHFLGHLHFWGHLCIWGCLHIGGLFHFWNGLYFWNCLHFWGFLYFWGFLLFWSHLPFWGHVIFEVFILRVFYFFVVEVILNMLYNVPECILHEWILSKPLYKQTMTDGGGCYRGTDRKSTYRGIISTLLKKGL